MTIQQLITLSLRDVHVVYTGQTPSSDELADGLNTLNFILDSWSNEGLLVPTHALSGGALTAGTNAYTFGVASTWVTTALPVKLKGAVASVNGFQKGLEILPMELFAASIANELGVTAALPSKLGIDNAAPARNIRVWPTPNNSAAIVELSYWTPLASVNLGDTVNFALPGFEEALRDELAMRLADMFQWPLTQAVVANAANSKKALARLDPSELVEPAPVPVSPQAR